MTSLIFRRKGLFICLIPEEIRFFHAGRKVWQKPSTSLKTASKLFMTKSLCS
ncbi:hypothetical protein BTN49_0652 [Candidatus Enterovibrio escicola]|uniref:Uncharacterized protein n=1 Tax=Candidatus Enterovibrio escicola TaxID=1927127 RepID=A0A2A5T6B0_9GAMM|nr:hypothetical protein BTN49_0652 [Candidatus Enterovibrio escacola]